MKNEIERIEQDAVGPVVGPPDDTPAQLEPSPDDEVPCPGDRTKQCKVKALLTSRERAGHVFLHLDRLGAAKRDTHQENDLGCALGWLGDWEKARDAFRSAKDKADKDAKARKRAKKNLEVAERALA